MQLPMLKIRTNNAGFTLLEVIAALTIIAILSTLALPSLESRSARAQINESIDLLRNLKQSVNIFYLLKKKFPASNKDAGIPRPELLLGNYVQRIELVNGAFQITFGGRANKSLKDKTLSIRPIVVNNSPESPISWICGNATPPNGMVAVGENITDIPNRLLPINCF